MLRRQFLAAHAEGVPLEALLELFGLRKSAAYDLLRRARVEGVEAAVAVKSRAPRHHPTALTDDVRERVLNLRLKHPWGPKKLRELYAQSYPDAPPSPSSIANILKASGEARLYQRRKRWTPTSTLTPVTAPNDVWSVDHKGAMRKLARCEPLNAIDLHSRFWIGCAPLVDKTVKSTRACFERWFDMYGLPNVIRVDAGCPWVSIDAPLGLTQLSSWWLSLGVRFEVVARCQQNGCVERLHGTMEREMSVDGVVDIPAHFAHHRHLYNVVRPHEALQMRTPASMYVTSTRRPVERVYHPYDDGCDEKRTVTSDGSISWRGRLVFVSESIELKTVGLRQLQPDVWSVRFHGVELGRLQGGVFQRATTLGTTSAVT